MESDNKLDELLSEITAQEEQLDKIIYDNELAGIYDPTIEDLIEVQRNMLRLKKEEIINSFKIQVQKTEHEGDLSPKVKNKPNTPSERIEKSPFHDVHQIKIEKTQHKIFKPPSKGEPDSPSAGRYKSPRVPQMAGKTNTEKSKLNQPEIRLSREKSSDFTAEKEMLLKDYHKCREIMNSAHEAMLLIKEKMLELKDKELTAKMKYVEKKIQNDSEGNFEPFEVEEEIKIPILVRGSPIKPSIDEPKSKEAKKKDLLDSIFGLRSNKNK